MISHTKVLLVDDHRMLREGLRRLLQSEADMEVVGEAEDGHAAVRMAAELSPDVVIMDINMPGMNGIDATRRILAGNTRSGPKVIALSALSDHRHLSEMLRAGATGYVIKASAFHELAVAVRAVVADRIFLSPAIAMTAEAMMGTPELISPRERQVLQLLAEGKSTKEVAYQLQLSTKTVETHRKNLMEKLSFNSVAELTKYALREGITALEV